MKSLSIKYFPLPSKFNKVSFPNNQKNQHSNRTNHDSKKSFLTYVFKSKDSKKNYKTTNLRLKLLINKLNITPGKSNKRNKSSKIYKSIMKNIPHAENHLLENESNKLLLNFSLYFNQR